MRKSDAPLVEIFTKRIEFNHMGQIRPFNWRVKTPRSFVVTFSVSSVGQV